MFQYGSNVSHAGILVSFCLLLTACGTSTAPSNTDFQSSGSETAAISSRSASRTELNGTKYVNDRLGFSMTLPLGWVLLPGSEAQPTFREGGCLPNRQHPCEQFQVFFRSQQDAKNPEDLFEARQAGNAHPIKMSASKSGVLIISADVLNPGESGWKFNYSFFFPGQKIGFNVLSSSRNFDDFITSIELLSDTSN